MATYFMFGKYSNESITKVSSQRTDTVVGTVERFNGQVVSIHALLGDYDVVIIVNLPGNQEAMELSVALSSSTGISFNTAPAISIERYDSLIQNELDMLGPEDDVLED